MSETSKYRHLSSGYCSGNGVDLGSGGDPVVPWAISVDLPQSDFNRYNAGSNPSNSIHWEGDATELPFKDNTLDFVYSSHLLEDFDDWKLVLSEWIRVLKPGGKLIVIMPDKRLWSEAIMRGQPPNCAHRHEGSVGELTRVTRGVLIPLEDRLTNLYTEDYSLIFVGQKP